MRYSPYEVLSECARIIGPPAPGNIRRGRRWRDNAVHLLTFCALKELSSSTPEATMAKMAGLTKEQCRPDYLQQQRYVSSVGIRAFVKWVHHNIENPTRRIENSRVRMLALAAKRVKIAESLPKVLAKEA